MVTAIVVTVFVPYAVLAGVLNYAAYRGRISYWTFLKVMGILPLAVLWLLQAFWVMPDGSFVLQVILKPFLLWLAFVGAFLGGLAVMSRGTPKAWCSMMDDKARARAIERERNR